MDQELMHLNLKSQHRHQAGGGGTRHQAGKKRQHSTNKVSQDIFIPPAYEVLGGI